MAVLETTIKRFIGHSSDPKPTVGRQLDNWKTQPDDLATITNARDLPAGSTFFEEDTGDIWRWNGVSWTLPTQNNDLRSQDLKALVTELQLLRIGMVAAGTCKEVK